MLNSPFHNNTAFRISNQAYTSNGEYITINSGQGFCDGSTLSFEMDFRVDGDARTASFSGTK